VPASHYGIGQSFLREDVLGHFGNCTAEKQVPDGFRSLFIVERNCLETRMITTALQLVRLWAHQCKKAYNNSGKATFTMPLLAGSALEATTGQFDRHRRAPGT